MQKIKLYILSRYENVGKLKSIEGILAWLSPTFPLTDIILSI